MFCKHCGKEMQEGDKFCAYCGQELKTDNGIVDIRSIFKQKEESKKIEKRSQETKGFVFRETYASVLGAVLVLLFILFWFSGAYDEGFIEALIGTVIFSSVLALLFTFFIKWWREYKSQKQMDRIETWKASIKNAGTSSVAFGWFLIILNILVYLSGLFYDYSEHVQLGLVDVAVNIAFAFTLIVLGNRIKNLTDKNIKKYLQILTGLVILYIILSLLLLQKPGILLIILLAYLISGLNSINKLLKVDEYKATLSVPKHKVKAIHWVVLIIAVTLLFIIGVIIDVFSDLQEEEYSIPLLSQEQISAIVFLVCPGDKYEQNEFISLASGVIVNSTGNIFTNRHVVSNEDWSIIESSPTCYVGVTDDISQPPKLKYLADLVAYSPQTDEYFDFDVAVLAIYDVCPKSECEEAPLFLPSSFPYLESGYSEYLSPGSYVAIAGYPEIGAGTWNLTEGIISGRVGDFVLKTDTKVDSGSSGGAALNDMNLLVGIPTWTMTGEAESMAYIIDIDSIFEWYEQKVTPSELIAVPFW